MPQIKENFFENILFKFESCSCDCVEDIEHIAPGAEPISKFKLQAMPERPILGSYCTQRDNRTKKHSRYSDVSCK